jgi:hypothetical protein
VSFRFYASAIEASPKLKSVLGPQGDPLLLCDLPSADHKRWTARNKLEVVAAVRGSLLSLTEACSRYRMSKEEFLTWRKPQANASTDKQRPADGVRLELWLISSTQPSHAGRLNW